MKLRYLPFLLGMMLIASPSFAQSVVFDEAASGDLSDSGAAPTSLTLGLGLNTVQGTFGTTGLLPTNGTGSTNPANDADFFTFTLAPGQIINAISTTRTGGGNGSFIGQANSNTIAGINPTGLDSGAIFANSAITSITSPGSGLAALGASLPLTGAQSFVIQETGAGEFGYSVSFNVTTAIPEPSSAALLGGLTLCGLLRRRRS